MTLRALSLPSVFALLVFHGSLARAATTYTTDFDLAESPISYSATWKSGLDPLQTPVFTANGIAFGTQTGEEFASKNYNDSEAWLAAPFPPNQRASAVIHKAPGLSGGYQEVEIILRWSVGPLRTGLTYGDTHSYGYEINLAWDGQYTQIARFKEPALFDSLVSGSPITSLGVKDGDIFSAEIVGNTITSKLTRNGVSTVLGTATDKSPTPFASGSPGVGYYRGTNGNSITNSTSFAFTSFSATSLEPASSAPVPLRLGFWPLVWIVLAGVGYVALGRARGKKQRGTADPV